MGGSGVVSWVDLEWCHGLVWSGVMGWSGVVSWVGLEWCHGLVWSRVGQIKAMPRSNHILTVFEERVYINQTWCLRPTIDVVLPPYRIKFHETQVKMPALQTSS